MLDSLTSISPTKSYLWSRLLCDNKFEGSIPIDAGKLNLLSELQFDENLTSPVASGTGFANRKFGHW